MSPPGTAGGRGEAGAPAGPRVPPQAMVLAAGKGERMRPLTEGTAKPALPLMNRPLLLHVLDLLARHGVRRAVVNLHHLPGSLLSVLEAWDDGRLAVVTTLEPSILGTAGGIRAALPRLDPGSDLLVLNADSLCDGDLADLAAAHERARGAAGAAATLLVRPRRGGEPYTPVHLDPEGRVSGIGDTGSKGDPVTFLGIHVLSPEALERIPPDGPSDVVRDVYVPMLREGRRLGACRHDGWWIEAGTPALYLKAHTDLLAESGFLGGLPRSSGTVLPGRGLVGAGGAERALVGAGCDGVERSRVEGSVIGPSCLLAEGCEVSGSLLGSRVRVGRGARVLRSIVWDGAEVAEGEALAGALLLPAGRRGGASRRVDLA